MRIINISKDIVRFEFLEILDRVTYSTNIYGIIHKDKLLLIDTGYFKYAVELKAYLDEKNYTIETVIVTHYHRDHAEGSVELKSDDLIASYDYEENYIKCQSMLEDRDYPKPNICIENYYEYHFYGHKIELYATPGHTPCSLSVLIDDDYLHVSDLLLEDINGLVIIPYIDISAKPMNHLESLKLLNRLNAKHLLLTHGGHKLNIDVSKETVERIYYLEKVLESKGSYPLELCLLYDKSQYAMRDIHRLNIRNIKKYNKLLDE